MPRRRTETLQTREKFFIVTNGEQTEKNYFELIKQKKSIYDVKIITENADTVGLVRHALNFLDGANQVWVVFDIDASYKEKRLPDALKLARENGIKVAFSNLAFEVWLISHYEQCEREMNTSDHKKKLDKILKELHPGLVYDKTDKEILKKYFVDKYPTAVTNAKIVYQKRVAEHNITALSNSQYKIWEWNSCTSVFKLIDALKLQIKYEE